MNTPGRSKSTLNKMKVVELREELSRLGEDISGKKADLVLRLENALEKTSEEQVQEELVDVDKTIEVANDINVEDETMGRALADAEDITTQDNQRSNIPAANYQVQAKGTTDGPENNTKLTPIGAEDDKEKHETVPKALKKVQKGNEEGSKQDLEISKSKESDHVLTVPSRKRRAERSLSPFRKRSLSENTDNPSKKNIDDGNSNTTMITTNSTGNKDFFDIGQKRSKTMKTQHSQVSTKIAARDEAAQMGHPSHEPTTTIRVNNFVRPFPIASAKALLESYGRLSDSGFWIDRLRTHCYATFQNVNDAINAKNALNNIIWPEGYGKSLSTQYSAITAEEVGARAASVPDRRRSTVNTTSVGTANFLGRPGPAKSAADRDAMTPRSRAAQRPPCSIDDLYRKTETKPVLYYLPLSEEQVERKKKRKFQPMERAGNRKRLGDGRPIDDRRSRHSPQRSRNGSGPWRKNSSVGNGERRRSPHYRRR